MTIKITMNPEEEFNHDVLYILQKLKREILSTETGKPVEFRLTTVIAAGYPSSRKEQQILKKLAEWGAVKLVGLMSGNWDYPRRVYTLEILYPKFEEVYRKYENLNQPAPSHAYVLTNSDLVDSLEDQVKNFKDLPEKGFFLGIGDYVKFIDENPGFEEIVSAINSFRERDRVKLSELEKQLLDDIADVEKAILGRVKGVEIISKIVEESIKEYEMRKDGRIQSSASRAEELYDGLGYLITILNENGYQDLVSDFIKFNPDTKSIADYKISEHYYPYKEELADCKSKIQKTIWGSWNELIVVYLVIHKYKEKMQELVEANDAIGQMNFYGLHQEMENVLGNVNDDKRRLQFIKDDYVSHINRVHSFIINKLKSDPNQNAEDKGGEGSLTKEYQRLLEDIKAGIRANTADLNERYQTIIGEIQSQKVTNLPPVKVTRTNLVRDIKKIIKTPGKFGKKEKKLLVILSDFKSHKIEKLVQQEISKSANALSHLKNRVNGKLSGSGFSIDLLPGDFSDPTGSFKLNYLTDSEQNTQK